jgi:hypothetical protein
MFFVEAAVFVLFLGCCCLWSLIRDGLRNRRERRCANQVSAVVGGLIGCEVKALEHKFGAPYEIIEGHFGRNLRIWKFPPARGFPQIRGVLVVTLTTDERERVTKAVWRRQ